MEESRSVFEGGGCLGAFSVLLPPSCGKTRPPLPTGPGQREERGSCEWGRGTYQAEKEFKGWLGGAQKGATQLCVGWQLCASPP